MTLTSLLHDRVVLVVGGTAGLGAGITQAAAREGATVAVAGRRLERAEEVAAELASTGARSVAIRCDVADPESARGAVRATVERFGRIDGLVNAAGLTSRGTLLDTTPELFDAHVATNLRGPFFTMQAAVADMVRRGERGTVVNIITSSELGGQPYLAPYAASKAGLATLTRNAAFAHRWDRIRINGLDIGWTETEGEDETQRRFHGAGDDWVEKAAAGLPMAGSARWTRSPTWSSSSSDRSGVVTGSVIDWDQNIQGCFD
jgi:NAD(P)-dependent dehydrogenase (short-subunit alcohol dehydrogenase family)